MQFKVGDKVRLEVTAEVTWAPGEGKKIAHFSFEDCCARLSDDEGPLGEVVGCIGAAIEIRDQRDENLNTFTIGPKEMWLSLCEAIDRLDLSSVVRPDAGEEE